MTDTTRSSYRLFGWSAILSLIALGAAGWLFGVTGAFLCLALILIEITFSFENAIFNARILEKMNNFWQQMFLTLGMVIAVFGMRLIFPLALVGITAGLSWPSVINLALHHPAEYAAALSKAHPYIASFGGMFLLALALSFFFDRDRDILWIKRIERPLRQIGRSTLYLAISGITLIIISLLPTNPYPRHTLIAGCIGIILFALLHFVTQRSDKLSTANLQRGGLLLFLYLQVLDASFSFDGVIGAFAITQNIILITIGLGVGALWVRSLTLAMVRRQTLSRYRYLEHGAHYTIFVLAVVLLTSLFIDIPTVISGILGLAIVSGSFVSSTAENKRSGHVIS